MGDRRADVGAEVIIAIARSSLLQFTPEIPFFCGPAVYDALAKRPEVADLMDRVRLQLPLKKEEAATIALLKKIPTDA